LVQTREEREALAATRLQRVLKTHGAAIARTIEQKISDAGPFNQRIDPHILNPVRNALVAQGDLVRTRAHGVEWYSHPGTSDEHVRERIETQFDVYRQILAGEFNARLGSVLEIAVFRALKVSPLISFGGFRSLPDTPTTQTVKKEEPPSIFRGRELSGNKRFDFLVGSGDYWAAIEVKNIREWLYPDRVEVRDTLMKAVEFGIPPIIISRRIPYVTRRLLSTAGVLLWETRHQYYPPEYANLAGHVRDKTSLGYFDVKVTDAPDPLLSDFITRIIGEELPTMADRFSAYSDLLGAFGRREMSYHEFAGRLRRREAGFDEDFDIEEDADVPF
jgi:hypothetical protein